MLTNLFDINVLDICLLSGLGVLFLYQLYFYVRYMAGVQRRVRHQQHGRWRWNRKKHPELDEPFEPGVSVVVCARNEGPNLQNYLQALLSQRYSEFEVIVVNDASQDNTQLVLEHYQHLYPQLRLTFVPTDAWVRSSKKLALTLAAKASKYDFLLLTDADCVPESPYWIREMMSAFRNVNTEVVLGYGGYFYEPGMLNRWVRYDTIFTAMQYLGMAMSGHPYMGVGRNLAYRKSTFFQHGGFAGLLSERAGDDDLFVNKVATKRNTDVVITPESFTWSIPKATWEEWRVQKYRHLSVSPAYRLSSRLLLGIEPLTRGLWYALLLAIAVLALLPLALPDAPQLSPLVWMVALLLFLVRLIWQKAMLHRASRIFRTPNIGTRVLVHDICLPVVSLCMLIRHRIRRKKEIRWN